MSTFHYEKIYYVLYDVSGKDTAESKYITEQQLRWLTNSIEVMIRKVDFIGEIVVGDTYDDFIKMNGFDKYLHYLIYII